MADDAEDICGLCGQPGADKFPHPVHWPTETKPDTPLVHAECEKLECERAFLEYRAEVGPDGIKRFLRNI